MMESNKTVIGKCPEHGVVHGDDVKFRFPEQALCKCGQTLLRVTIIEDTELQKRLKNE